jgi:hypothetical protein
MFMKIRSIVPLVCLLAAASTSQAQVGSGWSRVSFTKTAHYGGHWGGHYSSSGGVETFWIGAGEQRSEWMLGPRWSSGQHQFEGEVNTRTGSGSTGGSSVMQVFGIAGRNSDAFQLRVITANGGSYRSQTDNNPNKVLATGVYGAWVRVNTIHDANANRLSCYINGSQKFSGVDGGNASHYFKYGIYLRGESNPRAQWRSVKIFQK